MVEIAQPTEQRRVVIRRHGGFARDPSQQLAVRHLHELLELGEFLLRQLHNSGIGEAAHDQIHFPHSAMPGAEQELAPANIQSFARTCRAGHRFLIARLRKANNRAPVESPRPFTTAASAIAPRRQLPMARSRGRVFAGDGDIARRRQYVRGGHGF